MWSTCSAERSRIDFMLRTSPSENSAPPVPFNLALNLDKLTPILRATFSWVIAFARISPFSKLLFIFSPPFGFTFSR
nr:MAG TPA: hypothetical protein [Caudoviricetes sp.]